MLAWALLIWLSVPAQGKVIHAAGSSPSFAARFLRDETACPQTPADWHAWAQGAAADPESDSGLPMIERCEPPPVARQCLANLIRHQNAEYWTKQAGHSLGSPLDDITYYSRPPYPELQSVPPELQQQDFLAWMAGSEPADVEQALTRIEAINQKISDPKMKWVAFPYTSITVPSLDSLFGRFFVYVPGVDIDRYLQFAMPKAHAASIVAVQKTDPATHRSLVVPKVRLTDIWRTETSSGIQIVVNVLNGQGTENCYRCHKEPVLPIHPSDSFDQARFGARLAQVNKAMLRYGRVEIDGLDMDAYGPSVGPESSPVRTEALFQKCAPDLAPTSVARVRDLMTCARCHDGDTRAVLNFPIGFSDTVFSVYLTKHRNMPPGHSELTDEERDALRNCLTQEYYQGDGAQAGLLTQWIVDEPCWKQNGL